MPLVAAKGLLGYTGLICVRISVHKLRVQIEYIFCVCLAQRGQGSRDGSGIMDLDVDMDEVAALKASKICDEGQENKPKKKTEGHFELPNLKGTLQGVKLGLRQKKVNSSQQFGGEQTAAPLPVEGAVTNHISGSDKPQGQADGVKAD